jgi:chromosome segregation ATPase
VWPPEVREALATLAKERPALQRELGRLEGRLELTEQADSTLREQLVRERQRADQERERAQRLEAELAERRRGFWRLFVG